MNVSFPAFVDREKNGWYYLLCMQLFLQGGFGMRRLLTYLYPYRGRMAVQMTIKFVGTVMDLLLPWILATIIDDIVPLRDVRKILLWGGAMILCSILAVVTNIMANRMASAVGREVTRRLRQDLFSKICSLSCGQVDRLTIPSLEARLTTDTYNTHQMVTSMQRLGVRSPILLLGGVLITLTLEPVLTLVLLAVLPFIALVIVGISKKGIPLYTRTQQGVDRLVQVVRENISGIRVIKALSKTEHECQRFDQINKELVRRETRAAVTMAASNPAMNLLLNTGLTLILVAGAFRVNSGLTKPGAIIAFLSYFTIILNAMLGVNRIFVLCSKGSASARRIDEVLSLEEDLKLKPSEPVDTGDHIRFDHVSFAYGQGQESLTDISFSLRPGETLGIMGATGSGKTTILSLLMRFYDPTQGEIRISGRRVDSIPPDELRVKFGVVFQNDMVFGDSIQENIQLGRALGMERLRQAAADAQALDFIDAREGGFDSHLTARGTNISGGQRQRLLIARALAAKPEILILDDASSALDYQTDARLRQAIAGGYQGVTTIIVAQRVSSLRHADHILMLEEGRCIGCGTHDQLMKECPAYREIAISQMGGGSDAAD